MSTTLEAAMQELSKQIGDYWASTATSNGAAGGTTIVDTALKAKANDWVETGEAYDRITSGTYDEEERQISSLDNTTGTLTVLAHGGQIASAVSYEIHRLFTASDKRQALVFAARHGFPSIFQEVWDESLVSGNWLKDGSFERWSAATTPVNWTATTVTATQTSALPYYKHGVYSCKLSGSTGTLAQSITNFGDLQFLRGKNATFTCQGWCDTASSLRLSINDGSTQTYSDYHAGDSAWTEDNPRNDGFYVTQYIDPNATQVTFTIHYTTGAVAYVDDARVISGYRGKQSIGYLWLAKNRPSSIYIEPSYYSTEEEWIRIRDYDIDLNGYLYIPTDYKSDRRLRIRGVGYLDFLASGASSTSWAATIALDSPQLDILIAEAALYLYGKMAMPNFDSGTANEFKGSYGFWQMKLADAQSKYGMKSPPATIHWGAR